MKIKEKFTEFKEWAKEHKKGILIGGISALVTGIAVAIVKKPSKKSEGVENEPEEIDFGRNCTMRFVVDETQEVLGEVPCTELYSKEMIEDYEAFKN